MPKATSVKCIRCTSDITARATHTPCCSSHDKPMCCRHYRRAHFVELGWCCEADKLVRPWAPQPPEIVVLDGKPEREILSPSTSPGSPQDVSPGQS